MPSSYPETRFSLLHRLCHSEDGQAWQEFVSIYSPVIRKVARKKGFQSSDADNLVQEVLLAVSQAIEQWLERDCRGNFRAWLLRIARNEAINILTRRSTRPLGQDGETAEQIIQDQHQSDEISKLIDRQYQLAVYRAAAQEVKGSVAAHTWQAFHLTHIEGIPVAKAANLLGTRPGNIHFARSRIMAKIRAFVTGFEETNE